MLSGSDILYRRKSQQASLRAEDCIAQSDAIRRRLSVRGQQIRQCSLSAKAGPGGSTTRGPAGDRLTNRISTTADRGRRHTRSENRPRQIANAVHTIADTDADDGIRAAASGDAPQNPSRLQPIVAAITPRTRIALSKSLTPSTRMRTRMQMTASVPHAPARQPERGRARQAGVGTVTGRTGCASRWPPHVRARGGQVATLWVVRAPPSLVTAQRAQSVKQCMCTASTLSSRAHTVQSGKRWSGTGGGRRTPSIRDKM
ncbi:hypothetical protein WOLCODRAFT_167640 [Wolfiporia cocos MD-104 SS10]|uniref:Uncharacterized protein n=1 Tax=Wolfiporia cocos (strain MD-104) TaxID=742152 RepID=A0A2H3JA78_WOLCO|nr:hypothetical protein WOLCODRAFT_167640 [Wolfiporia cocos MD-104 SS10]